MDEGRKRVLAIAASILAARKLAQYDGGKRPVDSPLMAVQISILGDKNLGTEER
jgi:hypothetical protein